MTNLTIDRSTWLTGAALKATGGEGVLVDRRSGLSCVLGLYLQAVGVPKQQLTGVPRVENLSSIPHEAAWLLAGRNIPSVAAQELVDANDGPLHQTRREAKISRIFGSKNIAVTYTGYYRDATGLAKRVNR